MKKKLIFFIFVFCYSLFYNPTQIYSKKIKKILIVPAISIINDEKLEYNYKLAQIFYYSINNAVIRFNSKSKFIFLYLIQKVSYHKKYKNLIEEFYRKIILEKRDFVTYLCKKYNLDIIVWGKYYFDDKVLLLYTCNCSKKKIYKKVFSYKEKNMVTFFENIEEKFLNLLETKL